MSCIMSVLDLTSNHITSTLQKDAVLYIPIVKSHLDYCVFLRYESIIATLCENLDSLDEPDARAAMIWIVGEYAERIDNADELLESFLEGFHDESTQVASSEKSTQQILDCVQVHQLHRLGEKS